MNTLPDPVTPKCADCDSDLSPDEASATTEDGRSVCDNCFHRSMRIAIDSRPPKAQRFLHDVVCSSCGHEFMADSKSLKPEGCPECGELQPRFSSPQLRKAAKDIREATAHLAHTDQTLANLRREREAARK